MYREPANHDADPIYAVQTLDNHGYFRNRKFYRTLEAARNECQNYILRTAHSARVIEYQFWREV